MLFIVLFSLFASYAFRKETLKRGYDSKRATFFPLIAGGIAFVFAAVLGLALHFLLGAMGMQEEVKKALYYIGDFFVLALFIAAIAKNWLAIKELPFRPLPGAPPPAAPAAEE